MTAVVHDAQPVAAPVASPLAPSGCWRPCRRLHAGRWTELFLARPAGCSRADECDYVLKRVSRDASPDDRRFARISLARELQVASEVSQAHLATVLDADLRDDPAWLVMPYYGATTLAAMQDREPIVPQVCWQLRQLCGALDALHEAGWLHGDVCAENVVVGDSGHVTLIDAGLARKISTPDCDLSSTPFMGRLRYAAPESFESTGALTSAADLYSLGVLMFEWLAGVDPFHRYAGDELLAAKRLTAAPDLRSFNSALPYELCSLVARLLSREPLRRPPARKIMEQCLALEILTFAKWSEFGQQGDQVRNSEQSRGRNSAARKKEPATQISD